jgi:hypothetical protein
MEFQVRKDNIPVGMLLGRQVPDNFGDVGALVTHGFCAKPVAKVG